MLPSAALAQADGGGRWAWEAEAQAFVHGTRQSGARGEDGVYVPNHLDVLASGPVGRGVLTLRGAFSLESWTVGPRGTPQLLQTEGIYQGRPLRDRSHPHDLFSELSATVAVPGPRGSVLSLYGAAAGAPVYGAAAGAGHDGRPGPTAPIGHHAAELSFAVFTAGLSARWMRLEASVFNGREPDGERTDLDFRRLDSYAGRLVLAPGRGWMLSASFAYLDDPEPVLIGAPADTADAAGATSMRRLLALPGTGPRRHIVVPANAGPPPPTTLRTGTLALSRAFATRGGKEGELVAAYSVARHAYEAHRRQSGLLGLSLSLGGGEAFGRAEFVETTDFSLEVDSLRAPDRKLRFPGQPVPLPVPLVLDVGVLSAGYARTVARRPAGDVSVGVEGTLNLLPRELRAAYGSRAPLGVGVFVRVRARAGSVRAEPSRTPPST
ncbi:MAG TPA: hypothetical protein VE871_15550 [Longimicrobium sp.]|nr:hypothetical protein [Longimicrobium sp.]